MDLSKLSYDELHQYLTGKALMDIGKGETFRRVVADIIYYSLVWKEKQSKKEKK